MSETPIENPLFIDEPQIGNLSSSFPLYVDSICNLVVHSSPKFSVGIYGEWGTGKSTLLRNIKSKLEKDHSCTCVEFLAWRYENEKADVTIPLILLILNSFYKKIQVKKELLEEKTNDKDQNLKQKINRVLSGLSLNVSVGIPGLASVDLGYDFSNISENKSFFKFGKDDTHHKIEKFVLEQTKLHEGIDLIEKLVKKTNGVDINDELKLVVFIDDLDRCTPGNAAEIFEAIKVFLDIEGIVFILGLSHKIVSDVIEYKHKHFSEEFSGKEYLKKIIQLPVNIPKWDSEEIKEYLRSLLDGYNYRDFRNIFETNLELITQGVESNPRQIKRFLNIFILSYELVRADKSIDKEKLLAFQAVRERWEKLHDAISTDVSLLDRLNEMLIQSKGKIKPDKGSIEEQILQDKTIIDFLTGAGSIFLQITKNEWKHYEKVGSMVEEELETVHRFTEKDEKYYSNLISEFVSADKDKLNEIELVLKENNNFAGNLGYAIGPDFAGLEDEKQQRVWKWAMSNDSFTGGLGSSLGRDYNTLDGESREKLWELARTNDAFTTQLSYSLGRDYRSLDEDATKQLWILAKDNTIFAVELGAALGRDFGNLSKEAQHETWVLVKTNDSFASKLGYSIGENFASLDSSVQIEVLEISKQNDSFASKLGYFLGRNFAPLNKNIQEEIWDVVKKNDVFAVELGRSISRNIKLLPKDIQEKVFQTKKENNFFESKFITEKI